MADDTTAALVIELSAKFDQFKRDMESASGVFDANARKIAASQAKLKKQLGDWAVNLSGLNSLKSALLGLSAVGIVTGIGDLVTKSLDAASAIGSVAVSAGVSTDRLQTLRYAGSQAGLSFADVDTALITLNKNLGEFVNTGGGRAALAFKTLGIDKLIDSGSVRNSEQLFDALVSKIGAYGSAAQQAGFLSAAFGKEAGPKLAELMRQGAAGIAELEAKARSLGIVLSSQAIAGATEAKNKLGALFDVIEAEGVSAIAQLAPQIANIAQQLTAALPSLVAWVEHWADFFGLIKQDELSKLQYSVDQAKAGLDSAVAGGPLGLGDPAKWSMFPAAPDSSAEADYKKYIKTRQDAYNAALAAQAAFQKANPAAPALAPQPIPKLAINDIACEAAAAAAARRAQEQAQARIDALNKLKELQARADEDAVKEHDSLLVQLLAGQVGYYAAVFKQIADENTAKLAAIDAQEKSETDSLGRLKGLTEADRDNRLAIIKEIHDKAVQAANDAAAAAMAAKKTELRDSFEGTVTGLAQSNPFSPAADAAQNAGQAQIDRAAAQQQDSLDAAHKLGIGSEADYQNALLALEMDRQAKSLANTVKFEDAKLALGQTTFDSLATGLGDLFGKQSVAYKAAFAVEKAFQIARTALALEVAIAQAAAAPWPTNIPAIAQAISLGGQIMSEIASISGNGFIAGGYTGNGPANMPAGVVHAGEFVFNKAATGRIGAPNLAALQAGLTTAAMSGGRQSSPNIKILQQPGVAVQVVGTTADEVTLIATRVADERVATHTPKLVASEIEQPNSRISTALARAVRGGRSRS